MADQLTIHPETTLVVDRCRVIGGKESTTEGIRDERIGEARETERKTIVRIEDVEERETAERISALAKGIIRRYTTSTLIGSLAPRDRVAELERELGPVHAQASAFNGRAHYSRVEVGILPIPIAVALDAECARALADHVRVSLEKLRDLLRSGELSGARNLLRPYGIGNIDQLAVGVQADSIRFALEEARERLSELARKVKGDGAIAETPESIGRGLDLTMIESAIGMFTYGNAPALQTTGS